MTLVMWPLCRGDQQTQVTITVVSCYIHVDIKNDSGALHVYAKVITGLIKCELTNLCIVSPCDAGTGLSHVPLYSVLNFCYWVLKPPLRCTCT